MDCWNDVCRYSSLKSWKALSYGKKDTRDVTSCTAERIEHFTVSDEGIRIMQQTKRSGAHISLRKHNEHAIGQRLQKKPAWNYERTFNESQEEMDCLETH